MEQVNIVRSAFYPRAGVYAGYNYGESRSDFGTFRNNQSYGPSVGVFVNFNIFNGLRDYTNVKVQQIEVDNSRISEENSISTNSARLIQAYRNYDLARRVLYLESENIENVQQNVDIAIKKFDLASISSVEFREIQLQLLQAQNRLFNAQFNIRIHELQLRQLSGNLEL